MRNNFAGEKNSLRKKCADGTRINEGKERDWGMQEKNLPE
jgi:hypothetical protein